MATIKANNGKTYRLPDNPGWRDGSPPEIGWWPASRIKVETVLRFWDGNNWSSPITPEFNELEAFVIATSIDNNKYKKVFWTDRWWI